MIEEIHNSPTKAVVFATGGGFTFVDELMAEGGASGTVIDIQFPYSTNATVDLIGHKPEQFVSEQTAVKLAEKAFLRAKSFETDVIGIGLTCKLTTGEGEREGRSHLVYGSLKTAQKTITVAYNLTGLGDRRYQEEQTAKLILSLMGIGCKSKKALDAYSKHLRSGNKHDDLIVFKELRINKDIMEVVEDKKKATNNFVNEESIIFSGAFNPVHKNHIEIAKLISDKYGCPVTLEISIENADKESIGYEETMERIGHIRPHLKTDYIDDVIITRLPFFINKAELWPSASFVVGVDTYNRIVDSGYYGDYEDSMEALKNNKFIVLQRKGHTLITGTPLDKNVELISLEEYEDDGTSSSKIREN